MASRCRCPPDTLVPPWAIGDVELVGLRLDEVAGLRDLQGLPHLVRRWRPGCRSARCVAMVPENRNGFWGTNPMSRSSSGLSSSRTSIPPIST